MLFNTTKLDFGPFKAAITKQFAKMTKNDNQLYRVGLDKNQIWDTYLGSFPAGTNELYRERSEHDCNCCKSFIRNIGGVVAMVDGNIQTIWDIEDSDNVDNAYKVVAKAMDDLVRSSKITNPYLHYETSVGTDKSFQQLLDDNNKNVGVKEWKHFYLKLPKNTVAAKDKIDTILSSKRADFDVLYRSLRELSLDSVDTALELIAQGSLYRGEEHKFVLNGFRKFKLEFDKLTNERDQQNFAWAKAIADGPVAAINRIRNTAVGTLLIDLTADMDIEEAVKRFEKVMAPANYKRPTALITPRMIENAEKAIEALGLLNDLPRRHATIQDINTTNILYIDRGTKIKSGLTGSVFDELKADIPVKAKDWSHIEEVTIDKFLKDIVPTASKIEVLFEGKHTNRLFSLIAPASEEATNRLFQWDNGFSWTYNGDLADSDIKQAVAARGGNVTGVFRFSHSWNHPGKRNESLMDLHVFLPGTTVKAESVKGESYGSHTYHIGWNARQHTKTGAVQDVDYVNAAPLGHVPVENIAFPDLAKMQDGDYICKIHNWSFRNTGNGFKAEIEFGGELFQYDYDKPMKHHEWVTVAVATLKNGQWSIKHHLPESNASKNLWNIKTNEFQKVSTIMLSPNHWDGQVGKGNRHYLFVLENCKNPEPARGFYNENLNPSLNEHRKTFEVLGQKMKVPYSDSQLSGLGFSSTQDYQVVVRVTGKTVRVIRVKSN